MNEPAWVDQRGHSDCWIACLASLTGLPPESFPQPPEDLSADGAERMAYTNAVRRFLIERGWLLTTTWQHVPAGYAIAGGPSPRNEDGHAVVTHAGEVVHDPHPSRDGVAGPVEEYEVLIPLVRSAEGSP